MSSPRSFRSRMGGVVRRTSSVLSIVRPSTPSDSGSVKSIEATAPPATPPPPVIVPAAASGVPSPIAESPVREAAANADEAQSTDPPPLGPSPLSQEVISTPPTEEPSAPKDVQPVSEAQPDTIQPRIFESATGPGAFTDEPEGTSDIDAPKDVQPVSEAQPGTTQPRIFESATDPSACTDEPEGTSAIDAPKDVQPVSEAQPDTIQPRVFESATGPGAFTDEPEEMPHTQTEDSEQNVERAENPRAKEGENVEEDASGKDMSQISHHDEVVASDPVAPSELEQPANTEATSPENPTTIPVPAPSKEEVIVAEPSPSSQITARPPGTGAAPTIEDESSHDPVAAPTYDLDISGKEIWGPTVSKPSTPRTIRSMPLEDPFADPVPSAPPKITVTHELHEPQPVVMPEPSAHQVKPSRSIPSIRSGAASTTRGHYEFDETQPLLSRPVSPKPYLTNPVNPRHLNVSPGSLGGVSFPSASTWQATSGSHPRLRDLGWLEYVLPDTTIYFVHPTLHVTTDVDLRQSKNLEAVIAYFDRRKDSGELNIGSGMELWLQEGSKSGHKKRKGDWFVRSWVDHRKRSIILDTFWEGDGRGPRRGKKVAEDALDSEYRYWLFVEAHPAHVALPHDARSQAMDVLSWAWTDRLLPINRAISAPFTQDECNKLTNLLRSFGDTPAEAGVQPTLHTRIVARILLRAVQWRQMHFRPEKPLPQDAVRGPPVQPPPLRRAFLDFIVSCFCLGIPYIFFNRTQQQRIDEESGLRSAGPLVMIGACTCLMAAIVLSASVTFLSLPGLDNISRVVGFVAIILASFSMASTLVAIFEYKASLERAVPVLGGEGLMQLSRRNVIMSLPLVFLAYAVMAFVAGIALYSFRGVTLKDKNTLEQRFEDYTRWTVVGVIGGLAGILCTSALILRR